MAARQRAAAHCAPQQRKQQKCAAGAAWPGARVRDMPAQHPGSTRARAAPTCACAAGRQRRARLVCDTAQLVSGLSHRTHTHTHTHTHTGGSRPVAARAHRRRSVIIVIVILYLLCSPSSFFILLPLFFVFFFFFFFFLLFSSSSSSSSSSSCSSFFFFLLLFSSSSSSLSSVSFYRTSIARAPSPTPSHRPLASMARLLLLLLLLLAAGLCPAAAARWVSMYLKGA